MSAEATHEKILYLITKEWEDDFLNYLETNYSAFKTAQLSNYKTRHDFLEQRCRGLKDNLSKRLFFVTKDSSQQRLAAAKAELSAIDDKMAKAQRDIFAPHELKDIEETNATSCNFGKFHTDDESYPFQKYLRSLFHVTHTDECTTDIVITQPAIEKIREVRRKYADISADELRNADYFLKNYDFTIKPGKTGNAYLVYSHPDGNVLTELAQVDSVIGNATGIYRSMTAAQQKQLLDHCQTIPNKLHEPAYTHWQEQLVDMVNGFMTEFAKNVGDPEPASDGSSRSGSHTRRAPPSSRII